ncbi:DinB family protein [Bacillus pacificus]
MNQRPSEEEYAGSSGEYIRLVPDGNIIDILLAQEKQMTELLASLTESQAAYRYAEGKWTLKEVVGHITDAERVMTYRLLRFARGDQTPLTGFDQELFIPPFRKLDNRAISRRLPGRTAINDYIAVRATSGGVDPQGHSQQPKRYGARLAYGIAGHELHHMGVIRNRYLS